MKIAVIGANGRSGRAFVRAALATGHQVRAGVHRISTLPSAAGLEVVQCDATVLKDLIDLSRGVDAVVSFLGHRRGTTADLQTVAMTKLAQAMDQNGGQRLISLTGTGVRQPGDRPTITDRLLNIGLRITDPQRVKDGIGHLKILKDSDLDFTVIRVLKLHNGRPTPYRLTEHGPAKTFVSRRAVAMAILEVLMKDSFKRQTPIISRP